MEKTGHDAETLQAGWDKMIGARALTPKQVQEQSKGFSDVLSYMYGANATQEESVELGEMISDLILQGNLALAKRMDLSQAHILQLRKINLQVKKGDISAEEGIKRRQQFFVAAARTMAGETERVFDKPSGKIAQMHIQIQNLLENMGKPFVAKAGTMAESFREMSVSLGPVTEVLAKIVDEQLANLAKWLADHKGALPGWLNTVTERLKGVYDVLMLINKVPVLFDLRKFLKESYMPLPGPTGTTVPTVPKAMDWRYGGGSNQEAMEKAAEAVNQSGAPTPFEKKIIQPPPAPAGAGVAEDLAAKVAKMEGFSPKAYWDYKQWSIGHGTRAASGSETITQEGAKTALAQELAAHQRNVDAASKAAGLQLTPGQRDALTSFDFNTGRASELISSGSISEIERRMALYNKAGGKTNEGLINRRAKELEMFRGGQSLRDTTSSLGRPTAGGGGTQNISMNSPVTVNGVAPGREQMVARQVRTAVRDPMRQLLDQIKAARNYESRLGYV